MVPGIYSEEENKFFFNNVIVGRTSKARFKLINSNKVIFKLEFKLIIRLTKNIVDTS
jgi:hydrocephalus-inducing protein